MKKKCTKCGIEKELIKFNKDRYNKKYGLKSACKSCEKEYLNSRKEEARLWQKNYYKKNKEKINKRNNAYHKTKKGREYFKKYNKSDKGRESRIKSNNNWRRKNPLKYKAHQVVAKAIITRKIIKSEFCEVCSKTNCRIEGHHEYYSKPLEVIWVCKTCHDILDEQRRKNEKN